MKTSAWARGQRVQEVQQPRYLPDLLGDLILVTPPSFTILSVPQVRLFLRLDADNHEEDDLLADLIEMATDFCEKAISGHRQFRTAVFEVPVRCWWGGELSLPRHPLQSVAWIKYYDPAGTLQTLDSGLYVVRAPWRAPGEISLAPQQVWPYLEERREFPVLIRMTAGYAAGKCPPTVKQAMRLLITQAYWQRCPVEAAVSDTVRRLLDLEGCRYK